MNRNVHVRVRVGEMVMAMGFPSKDHYRSLHCVLLQGNQPPLPLFIQLYKWVPATSLSAPAVPYGNSPRGHVDVRHCAVPHSRLFELRTNLDEWVLRVTNAQGLTIVKCFVRPCLDSRH